MEQLVLVPAAEQLVLAFATTNMTALIPAIEQSILFHVAAYEQIVPVFIFDND